MMLMKQFTVRGERGSGTNYITNLIRENLSLTYNEIRWKHDVMDENFDGIPVITISKSIFCWLPSVHKRPWHMLGSMGLPFEEFVRSECVTRATNPEMAKMYGVQAAGIIDRYPNPMKMYVAKNEKFQKVSDYHVRYIDLLRDPEKIIEQIAELLKIKFTRFKDVTTIFSFTPERKEYYLHNGYMKLYDKKLKEFVLNQVNNT